MFTQFQEIIEPLSTYLAGVFGREGLILHGGTAVKKRQDLVKRFQEEDGPPFFVLSLKAGGTGLNLTRASHVDPFRPLVEPCGGESGHRPCFSYRPEAQRAGS